MKKKCRPVRSCLNFYWTFLHVIPSTYLSYSGPTQITTVGPTTATFVQSIASVETRIFFLIIFFSFSSVKRKVRRVLIDLGYANNPLNKCRSLINEFHIGSLISYHSWFIHYSDELLFLINHFYHLIIRRKKSRSNKKGIITRNEQKERRIKQEDKIE